MPKPLTMSESRPIRNSNSEDPDFADDAASVKSSGSGDDVEIDDYFPIERKKPAKVLTLSLQRAENEGFVAYSKTLNDVEVTEEANNPCSLKKFFSDDSTSCHTTWDPEHGILDLPSYAPTPLKSIGGNEIKTIKTDDLRMFCARNDIPGARHSRKAEICWAIVKAKAKFEAGVPPPYKDLMPRGKKSRKVQSSNEEFQRRDKNASHYEEMRKDVERSKEYYAYAKSVGYSFGRSVPFDTANTTPIKKQTSIVKVPEEQDPTDISKQKKKRGRKRKIFNVDATSIVVPPLVPRNNTMQRVRPNSNLNKDKFISLQNKIVQSIESKNNATRLRETVTAASDMRRCIRDEKNLRSALWQQLVENFGDDDTALEHIGDFKKSKRMNNNNSIEDEEEVRESVQVLMGYILDQDELIDQMNMQYNAVNDALNDAISNLSPK